MTMEPWFRLATNFFCRVYTLNDTTLEGEEEDVSVNRDILAASIQAIKGLLEHAADIGIQSAQLIPQDRRNLSTLEEAFSIERIPTRRQWRKEERLWAEALNKGYDFK